VQEQEQRAAATLDRARPQSTIGVGIIGVSQDEPAELAVPTALTQKWPELTSLEGTPAYNVGRAYAAFRRVKSLYVVDFPTAASAPCGSAGWSSSASPEGSVSWAMEPSERYRFWTSHSSFCSTRRLVASRKSAASLG
jgi:hypothetical protein